MSTPDSGPYVPTDNPLYYGKDKLVERGHVIGRMVIQDIPQYGFVPPNFRITPRMPVEADGTSGYKIHYADIQNDKVLTARPLSPNGAKDRPSLANEFVDTREDIVSLFQPPVPQCQAGNFKFQAYDDWESALAASLTESGVENIAKDVVTKICKQLK